MSFHGGRSRRGRASHIRVPRGEALLPYRTKDENSDHLAQLDLETVRMLEKMHADPEMIEFYRQTTGDHSVVDWSLLAQDFDGLEASNEYVDSSSFFKDCRCLKDWDVGNLVLFRTDVIRTQAHIDSSNCEKLADNEALLRALGE